MFMRLLVQRAARSVLAAAFVPALLLAACSSGGGSVTIANSQPADSQTTDFGIAYIKRTVPTTQDDLRLRRTFFPQADLYVLNPTSAGGNEQNITARVTAKAPAGTFYDLKDVDVSSDGTRIIFAMRGPLMPKQMDLDPPNWNIWEYVVATNDLHTILPTTDPQGTESQYISPHYLPDGRILFATTRQIGAGFSSIDTGLRLRYEFSRNFAPYIGVVYEGNFGQTASFAKRTGESTGDFRFAFGVRVWF